VNVGTCLPKADLGSVSGTRACGRVLSCLLVSLKNLSASNMKNNQPTHFDGIPRCNSLFYIVYHLDDIFLQKHRQHDAHDWQRNYPEPRRRQTVSAF
jgi:hypothetical protein